MLNRTLHPEVKIEDERRGIATYIASDETLDADREVIRAKGWRFDHFRRNSPFVNSHRGGSIDDQLGKVIDYKVARGKLIETVQWAIDAGLPETHLAMIGWKMTAAGYLKAVSVGFHPVKVATEYGDRELYREQLRELRLEDAPDENKPRKIFVEQQQIELSSVIIGSNSNAVLAGCKAYRAGVLSDAQAERIFPGITDDPDKLLKPKRDELALPSGLQDASAFFDQFKVTVPYPEALRPGDMARYEQAMFDAWFERHKNSRFNDSRFTL